MTFGKLIGGARARELVNGPKKAVLIDLADPVSFRDHKVPGSINLPLRRISSINQYDKDQVIILMGDEADPQTLSSALTYVAGYGMKHIYYLKTRADYQA